MPSDWELLSPAMDEEVDARLGDTISLSLDGGHAFTDVMGFVFFVTASGGLVPYDEHLGSKPRVKISKKIMGQTWPDNSKVRLRSAKLGDYIYKPHGSEQEDDGRYWLFDVQRVGQNSMPAPTMDSDLVSFENDGISWDAVYEGEN